MEAPDLDVVVLGGGGHVGLPLSLAFAASGLRVGVFDTNAATREPTRFTLGRLSRTPAAEQAPGPAAMQTIDPADA